jgi:glycerol-3-phosphate dehydrogenase (NAD(P)+)
VTDLKISVLGSGGWGTALAILLNNKGYEVKLWSAFENEIKELSEKRENKLLPGVSIPDRIGLTTSYDEAADADMFLLAVPSHVVKKVCVSFKKYYNGQIIVNVAKGFDEENDERLSEVIKKELSTDRVVVLSGPTHAEEVARGIPTAIVAACEDLSLAGEVQEIFSTGYMRVYTNTDVAGVEVCGAIKNVIALCAGISDGCGFGDNTKAALMTRGLTEIARLGVAMGANQETFAGLTGVGDLIVTCTSKHSRNRRAGTLIAKGMKIQDVLKEVGTVEGYFATLCARTFAQTHDVYMPITEQCYAIMYENKDVQIAIKSLLSGPGKDENEEIWLT